MFKVIFELPTEEIVGAIENQTTIPNKGDKFLLNEDLFEVRYDYFLWDYDQKEVTIKVSKL